MQLHSMFCFFISNTANLHGRTPHSVAPDVYSVYTGRRMVWSFQSYDMCNLHSVRDFFEQDIVS